MALNIFLNCNGAVEILALIYYQTLLYWNSFTKNKIDMYKVCTHFCTAIYIYIYIYIYCFLKFAHSVMIIVIGNGHGEQLEFG